MLEGLVATLLNRFLGMYVENFDTKQLNIGIWSGDVKLRNLQLRKEALDQLHLPLNVVKGHLGQLILQIPWSNLRGKPVRVTIEDVFLLAAPKEVAEYDHEEEEARAYSVKMEKLENAELLKERNAEGMSSEEQQKNQSFTAQLVTAIVNNLQITIKNIHVRYEDTIADPGHPFTLGITLQNFSAVSTDENWKPTFIQASSGTTFKLATLDALAVYWDTDAALLGSGKGSQADKEDQTLTNEELLSKFRNLIVSGDNASLQEHQFILKPVSGRAGLEIDNLGRIDRPKLKARLLFEELGFVVDEDQYRDALMLVDLFHYFKRHQEYKRYEPKSKPKEDPKAWFRFAGTAILNNIHERNRRWTWDFFRERRDNRKRYIELFKKRKKEESLSPDETKELVELEKTSSYEDLRFWRSLARNQLRKENIGVKKEPQSQTWSQWLWGGGKAEKAEHADESQMSEEQRKELYNVIDWDEKKALSSAVDTPKDVVKAQIEMSLRTGSFTLRRDPQGTKIEILRLLFDSFALKFLQRPESFLAEISLEGMRLYDGTTPGNLHPQIIKIRNSPAEPVEEDDDDEKPGAAEGKIEDLVMPMKEASTKHFFYMAFENNPLDGSADTALSVELKGFEIIYNAAFVVGIVKFFKPPERHMESVGALLESAGAAVEGFRQQTRAGLEFALEEHKTINAHLDLQAPLIIIPDSVTEPSRLCLMVDAGHARLNSELVDKATIREVQSKQKQKYTDEDYQQLEDLMYDRFLLKLDSTQILVGKTIEETRSQLQLAGLSQSKNFHVVDRINIDFKIETCIVPKASGLTKFRIIGHLPILHASLSDEKYKSLMRIIDIAVPKFNEDISNNNDAAAVTSQPASSYQGDALAISRSAAINEDFDLDGSSDDESNTTDSNQKVAEREILYKRRAFEFIFKVDKLQGSLYKSTSPDGSNDQLLVELVAENFQLQFYQRLYDINAELSLEALFVEDNIEKNPLPEFRNILSSKDLEESTSKEKLLQLKFVKVDSKSPEFESTYESIATNLEVYLSTINLVITRKTVLTLLDFVLVTFANNDKAIEQRKPDLKEISGDGKEISEQQPPPEASSEDRTRIKANLNTISIMLNNDGIRLATASLRTANVDLFLIGKDLKLSARLGDLSVVDDVNEGVPADSPLRQLISIEGDELADFKYEKYDLDSESYPGYASSVYLRSGSLRVNFLTEPIRKIMDFSVKFGKMQAVFNAAREAAAQQASQMQENASDMHFDILVKTPIIVFPKMVVTDEPESDQLTAELGEIYAKNEFSRLDDTPNAQKANKISAGIRNVRLNSRLHYEMSKWEDLELLDKVDLHFDATMIDHEVGIRRPEIELRGTLSKVHLRITQKQLQFMLELSRSIPAAFASDPAELSEEDIEQEFAVTDTKPTKEATILERKLDPESDAVTSQSPEIRTTPTSWTKIDMIFKAGALTLELIQASETEPVKDLDAASLSVFSLNDTKIKMRMINDGSLESELLIRSFTISDTRKRETNKFRKIMSLFNREVKQQFMANLSVSGGATKEAVVILTIDSPKIILALDYIFAILDFVNRATSVEDNNVIEEAGDDDDDLSDISEDLLSHNERQSKETSKKGDGSATTNVSFRLNLVDAQVVLLANPASSISEAIVLGTKHVLLAKQHATALQVDKVGMFLCRMDKFETSRLRILDDFSIQATVDMQAQNQTSPFTLISVNIDPLTLRLSLRDILLALQTISKASELSGSGQNKENYIEPAKLKEIKGTTDKDRIATTLRHGTSTAKKTRKSEKIREAQTLTQRSNSNDKSGVIRKEEMKIDIQGLRVVLIGDTHELPMVDWNVKKFAVEINDWSSAMIVSTSLETLINVFNFSKSTWEPLMEPWSLGFHLSKDPDTGKMSADLFSRKSVDFTFTTATIALASHSAQFLSTDEDVLSKPRGMESPYRFRNYTGFDLHVWAASDSGNDGPSAKLADGEEIPWRFEDPSTTRENLAPEGVTGIVGIRLNGSGFDSIERITVNREAENLYGLIPKKDNVQHRMAVEIKLGTDSVKYVTFRSPLLVENMTQIPFELGIFNHESGDLLKIVNIAPGDARPAPIGSAYIHSLLIRPDQGFGYQWSTERLYWRDIVKRPVKTLMCYGEQSNNSPPFYIQTCSVYDKKNPLTK